jgi:hypothetical protein
MLSSNPALSRQQCSLGRGFSPLDPERQREVVGYVRGGPGQPGQQAIAPGHQVARTDWMRVQPDRDFEGSSSRHGR